MGTYTDTCEGLQSPVATPTASSTSAIVSQSPKKGLSTGAKAGIGVGAAIGGLALIGCACVLGTLAYRRRTQSALASNEVKYEQVAAQFAHHDELVDPSPRNFERPR